jgi:ribosome-binding protein aMBF1 (putative translation factor)
MQAVTKKPPIEHEMVTVRLKVHRSNVNRLRKYAHSLESGEGRKYCVAEVFPEYVGKEHELALRAYRTREGLTQMELARITQIPQRHISEMENRKRGIGKERAKVLAKALNVSDYRLFL